MRAVVADRSEPPDGLSIREVPRPTAGPEEVRVRVHATTVSRTDCGKLRGHPRLARVFGMAPGGTGAHAEYLCVPDDGAIA